MVRNEIKLLKKLRHKHIIKFVGTYTYRECLGLFYWPVALSHLATFLEDIKKLKEQVEEQHTAAMEDIISSVGRVNLDRQCCVKLISGGKSTTNCDCK